MIRRKLAGEMVREGPLEEVTLPWREPCRDGAVQRERQVKVRGRESRRRVRGLQGERRGGRKSPQVGLIFLSSEGSIIVLLDFCFKYQMVHEGL